MVIRQQMVKLQKNALPWLLGALLLEVNCIELLVLWAGTRRGAVAYIPDESWWIAAINQTVFVAIVGALTLWRRWFGVTAGVILFFLFLIIVSVIKGAPW